MARKGLTAKKLDNVAGKRQKSATRLWDGDGSGFGAKVSAAGRVTFFQFYYAPAGTVDEKGQDISGKRRFMTLGTYSDAYGLADARKGADAARALLDKGKDPQQHARTERERATREQKQAAQRGTVAGVLALLLWRFRRKGRTRRYIHDARRAWHRDVFPEIPREKKAADVTPQDIRRVLHRPLSRGSEHSARTLRATLHLAFKLAMQSDHDPRNLSSKVEFRTTANPVEAVPLAVEVNAKDRELSFPEIGRVWHEMGESTANPMDTLLIRLLLALGGQHITELREATWSEFDLDAGRWLIRAERHKNRTRDHLLPINKTADALLRELHTMRGRADYLFPQVRKPHLPMRVERPGAIIAALLEWQARLGKPMDKFTAADFRRTCKTRMHEIGIPKATTNHLHNHDFAGVSAKHYDRFDYWSEKQRAMTAWDIALRAAIDGKPVPEAECRAAMRWQDGTPTSGKKTD
ncbi:tyrosine-type recombinase/integrase [Aquisalimonas sp. APHAB1-3]|uniref:tyrosine-type recombinase/integrase n=1 Tax=Aquisalimonas sp. APHAB1-3 TaxID=3402080 RepID=UPI003AABFCAF